jgi:hypothetical protein
MDSTSQTSVGNHTCICSDLFDLVEKQRIQLNEKDKQLQVNRQANEVKAGFLRIFINTILLSFIQGIVNKYGFGKSSSN